MEIMKFQKLSLSLATAEFFKDERLTFDGSAMRNKILDLARKKQNWAFTFTQDDLIAMSAMKSKNSVFYNMHSDGLKNLKEVGYIKETDGGFALHNEFFINIFRQWKPELFEKLAEEFEKERPATAEEAQNLVRKYGLEFSTYASGMIFGYSELFIGNKVEKLKLQSFEYCEFPTFDDAFNGKHNRVTNYDLPTKLSRLLENAADNLKYNIPFRKRSF